MCDLISGKAEVSAPPPQSRVGDDDEGGDGDGDGRIFPGHPSPFLHAPRDMISLVRGGWGLDALGKFFFRRRRRPPGFEKRTVLEFYYGIGASRVRGSIRLVERLPKVILPSKKNYIQK